jgi:uncharacterized protein (DUF3820 family)
MIERDLFTGKLLVDKTEKLNFGKYQGRTLSTVMITDPQYLVWVVKESNNKYKISETWREYIEEYSYTQSKKRFVTYMK